MKVLMSGAEGINESKDVAEAIRACGWLVGSVLTHSRAESVIHQWSKVASVPVHILPDMDKDTVCDHVDAIILFHDDYSKDNRFNSDKLECLAASARNSILWGVKPADNVGIDRRVPTRLV